MLKLILSSASGDSLSLDPVSFCCDCYSLCQLLFFFLIKCIDQLQSTLGHLLINKENGTLILPFLYELYISFMDQIRQPEVGEGKFFIIREFQLIKVKGMIESKQSHFLLMDLDDISGYENHQVKDYRKILMDGAE